MQEETFRRFYTDERATRCWNALGIGFGLVLFLSFTGCTKIQPRENTTMFPAEQAAREYSAGAPRRAVETVNIKTGRVTVGDTADTAFELLTPADRISKPDVSTDPDNSNSLLVVQHFKVAGQYIDVTLTRKRDPGPYIVKEINVWSEEGSGTVTLDMGNGKTQTVPLDLKQLPASEAVKNSNDSSAPRKFAVESEAQEKARRFPWATPEQRGRATIEQLEEANRRYEEYERAKTYIESR